MLFGALGDQSVIRVSYLSYLASVGILKSMQAFPQAFLSVQINFISTEES